jgi:hypothetical protein
MLFWLTGWTFGVYMLLSQALDASGARPSRASG